MYIFTIKTLSGTIVLLESDTPTLTKQEIVNQLVEMGEYTKHQGYYLSVCNENNENNDNFHYFHYNDVLYTLVQFPRFIIRYLNVKKELLVCHECIEKECEEKHCNYSILKLDCEYIRRPVYHENTKTIKYIYDYFYIPYDDVKIDESSYGTDHHIWFEWDDEKNEKEFEDRCKAIGFNVLLPRVPLEFGNVFNFLQCYDMEDNGCICDDLSCPFYKGYKGNKNENNQNNENNEKKTIDEFISSFTYHLFHLSHTPHVFQSSRSVEKTLLHLLRHDNNKIMRLSEWMNCVCDHVKHYNI